MELDTVDPLDWTIDQVVNFLCHTSLTPWSQSANPPPLPEPIHLETIIRENMINGDVLLNHVEMQTLREDLGIKILAHRSAVLSVVRYLRQLSLKYQSSRRAQPSTDNDDLSQFSPTSKITPRMVTGNVRSSLPPDFQPITPPDRLLQSSVLGAPSASAYMANSEPRVGGQIGRSSQFNGIGFSKSQENSPDIIDDNTNNRFVDISTFDIVRPIANTDVQKAIARSHPRAVSKKITAHAISPHLRPHERLYIDSEGKKRRKIGVSTNRSSFGETAIPSQTLTFQRPAIHQYMGLDKLDTVSVFYPLRPDSEARETSFVILGTGLPTAQRLFVKNRLHHFFQQQPVKLGHRDGYAHSAIIPYEEIGVNSADSRFFTLYSARNGEVTVKREEIAGWPELRRQNADHLETASKERDSYDYLLEKYPVKNNDEEPLPVFGESGSEGEYDSDTWHEIQDERVEMARAKSKYLTSHDINMVIERCCKEYEERWKNNHLPKHEHKARRIWLEARKTQSKNQQTKTMLREIELLERRLRKIKKEIHVHKYAKASDLEFQCQSMEQTIFDIALKKWRISILEKRTCPAKVPFVPKVSNCQAKNVRPDLDEESLDSQSDDAPDDYLDDFIVPDAEDSGQKAGNCSLMDIDEGFPAAMGFSMTSSDSDDVISVSGKRRKQCEVIHPAMAKGREKTKAVLPSSPIMQLSPPSHVTVNGQDIEMIDLTSSRSGSPGGEEFEITTPPLNPARPANEGEAIPPLKIEQPSTPTLTVRPPVRQTSEAITIRSSTASSLHPLDFRDIDVNDFKGMEEVKWRVLEDQRDRHRLLTKHVAGLPDDERSRMTAAIPHYNRDKLENMTFKALNAMLQHSIELPGVDKYENDMIMRVASLYVSWTNCARLKKAISKHFLENALNARTGFRQFANELAVRLAAYSQMLAQEVAPTVDDNSPSPEESEHDFQATSSRTPHKKRKRHVKESQHVKDNHLAAQLRVVAQEEQQMNLEQKLERMGVSNTDPEHQAVSFEQPVIYLDSHIGGRVKSHQLHGIQFMWRELIQDKKSEGCLLAHTMGLGKTMQVISLLVTIAAAASSGDASVRNQVPARFRRSQTLILCPSSLIDNWYEEFLMWTPREHKLGPLRKITSSASVEERLSEVALWNESGGVLILSYGIFRNLVHNKETKSRAKALSDKKHALVREQLLEGPNIIVADEAHKMKNRGSGLSAAATLFESKSRIALTGSPLANNLIDYFAMVDWIAPGYLGNFVEFKANYVEPIEDGLYADSTYPEKRKSLKKLQVLKEILNPKINRADISVLKGSLPPKVEFLIVVSLTDLQKKAYNLYVTSLLERRLQDVRSTTILSWLAILGLCCNHPACFNSRLQERANQERMLASSKKSDELDQEEMPGDEPISQTGLSESMIASEIKFLSTVPDLNNPMYSHRARILDRLIDESIKVGDKILIFSHSLLTLDYLERLLQSCNRKYSRLDGSTPIETRQASTKNFSSTQAAESIYLISTRAGGLGLNIPGANRVVLFDFSFNPTWEEQAVGRAYRLGQKKEVFVYRFIAGGTFEEVTHNKSVFKTQLAMRVVDKKNVVRWASKSLGDYVFPAKEVKAEDVSEYIGKDPHVLDKVIRDDESRSIRKITLTETFQREDNDKLTDEEKKDVEEQLDDERLRRSDPEAYERKIREKQEKERQLIYQARLERERSSAMNQQSSVLSASQLYSALVYRLGRTPPPPSTASPDPRHIPIAYSTSAPLLSPDTTITDEHVQQTSALSTVAAALSTISGANPTLHSTPPATSRDTSLSEQSKNNDMSSPVLERNFS